MKGGDYNKGEELIQVSFALTLFVHTCAYTPYNFTSRKRAQSKNRLLLARSFLPFSILSLTMPGTSASATIATFASSNACLPPPFAASCLASSLARVFSWALRWAAANLATSFLSASTSRFNALASSRLVLLLPPPTSSLPLLALAPQLSPLLLASSSSFSPSLFSSPSPSSSSSYSSSEDSPRSPFAAAVAASSREAVKCSRHARKRACRRGAGGDPSCRSREAWVATSEGRALLAGSRS